MTYKAIVENGDSVGFTATILGWPGCTATAATRDEVLARLRRTLRDRLARAEIVPIEVDVPEETHPWMEFAGMFKDDPLFDEVVEDMKAYRREIDAEPPK
jgi:hypothetical protein